MGHIFPRNYKKFKMQGNRSRAHSARFTLDRLPHFDIILLAGKAVRKLSCFFSARADEKRSAEKKFSSGERDAAEEKFLSTAATPPERKRKRGSPIGLMSSCWFYLGEDPPAALRLGGGHGNAQRLPGGAERPGAFRFKGAGRGWRSRRVATGGAQRAHKKGGHTTCALLRKKSARLRSAVSEHVARFSAGGDAHGARSGRTQSEALASGSSRRCEASATERSALVRLKMTLWALVIVKRNFTLASEKKRSQRNFGLVSVLVMLVVRLLGCFVGIL